MFSKDNVIFEKDTLLTAISNAIKYSKEEIIELIPFMIYHPSWYVQKLLYERYGITEEEFNNACENIA